MRTIAGRERRRSSLSATMRCSAATDKESSSIRSARRSRSSAVSRPLCVPDRAETTVRTGSGPRRRSANSRTALDGGSSHCRSSIARTTGLSDESSRSTVRTPAATARRSGGRSDDLRSSAASSAAACGTGNAANTSSGVDDSRSDRPVNESFASDSAGRVIRTRPCSCARPTAASQTVVLPMPGSPSTTSAAAPPRLARNASTTRSSSSRPTTLGTRGAYPEAFGVLNGPRSRVCAYARLRRMDLRF